MGGIEHPWGVLGRCTAAMHGSRTCLRPDPRLEIARVVPLMLHWSRPVWMYAKVVPKPPATLGSFELIMLCSWSA